MPHIRVISLDFDGCLSHEGTLPEASKNGHYDYYKDPNYDRADIVSGNPGLLSYLKESSNPFDTTKVFIGSNRQSAVVDRENGLRGSASCYSKISEFAHCIKATFDPLLMADIYSNQAPGSAYYAALRLQDEVDRYRKGFEINTHPDWLADDRKLSILTAQMHKVAAENPQDTITYEFFDDNQDILNSLNGYFQKHPELIPSNVTLKLHHYGPKPDESQLVTEVATIRGTGTCQNYRTLVWNMAAVCLPKIFVTLGTDVSAKRVTSVDQVVDFQSSEKTPNKAIMVQGKLNMMDHYTPGSRPAESITSTPRSADPQVQFALDTLRAQIEELESESYLSSLMKENPKAKIDALKYLCEQIMEKGGTQKVSDIIKEALKEDQFKYKRTENNVTQVFKASVRDVIEQHRSKVFGFGDTTTKKIIDTLLDDLEQGQVASPNSSSSMQFN